MDRFEAGLLKQGTRRSARALPGVPSFLVPTPFLGLPASRHVCAKADAKPKAIAM